MKYELNKEGVFTPSFNGNKELPPQDQIIVKYKNPTLAIRDRCRKKPKAKGIGNERGGIDHFEIIIEKDELVTVREMLISISNCSYVCDGQETKIVTVNDLINAPIQFAPLYKEIVEEFDKILDKSDIDEKN